MRLTLSDTEASELKDTLVTVLDDMAVELRRTEGHDYRRMLKIGGTLCTVSWFGSSRACRRRGNKRADREDGWGQTARPGCPAGGLFETWPSTPDCAVLHDAERCGAVGAQVTTHPWSRCCVAGSAGCDPDVIGRRPACLDALVGLKCFTRRREIGAGPYCGRDAVAVQLAADRQDEVGHDEPGAA